MLLNDVLKDPYPGRANTVRLVETSGKQAVVSSGTGSRPMWCKCDERLRETFNINWTFDSDLLSAEESSPPLETWWLAADNTPRQVGQHPG